MRGMASRRFLELFERTPLPERLARISHGLRQPQHTGAYKLAIQELQHLVSWTAAIAVPLVIAVALTFAFVRIELPRTPAVEILPDPKPLDDLDEIQKIPDDPIEKAEPVNQIFTQEPLVTFEDPSPDPGTAQAEQPKLGEFPPVPSIKIMPGLSELRDGDGRNEALKKWGPPGTPTECAVLRALRWLKHCQEPDGSWKLSSGGNGGGDSAAAMTGLALLTFLAHGETPDPKCVEFGETVRKAIEWLVEHQEADGRFSRRDPHDYSHPIAITALCEAYTMTRIPAVGEAAEKGLDIILQGQHPSGGWDYNCKQSPRDDTSYMGWCAQALKAAHIARLKSDDLDAAIARAVNGFKKNAHPQGGFGYTGSGQGGLTAVGTLCMQLLGASQDTDARQGLLRLDRWSYQWESPSGKRPLYYWYYATYARFFEGGEQWKRWNGAFAAQLVNRQVVLEPASSGEDNMGYWDSPSASETHGRVYSTALCTLMLEVYYKYLPSMTVPEGPEPIQRTAADPAGAEIEIVLPENGA